MLLYHASNKFPAFPLVKMTSRDCPIFYYIGSATKNMGLVKFTWAAKHPVSYYNIILLCTVMLSVSIPQWI